jgi:hypothetical protein
MMMIINNKNKKIIFNMKQIMIKGQKILTTDRLIMVVGLVTTVVVEVMTMAVTVEVRMLL